MWWGMLIVGCFYLIQGLGIVVDQFAAGLGIGFVEGLGQEGPISFLDMQFWLLPLSLVVGTVTGMLVCLKMTGSRSSAEEPLQWLYDLVWSSDGHFKNWNYGYLGLGIGFVFLILTLYVAPPPEDLPQPLFEAMLASPFFLQIGWVCLIVVAFPIIEEILFRGILQGQLRKTTWGSRSWLNISAANGVTSILFAGIHMINNSPIFALTVFAPSLLFGYFRDRCNSVYPPILLHSAFNALVIDGLFIHGNMIMP